MAKKTQPNMGISVQEMGDLRRKVLNLVNTNMAQVTDVLNGRRQWSPTQTKLFLALFDKVLPTLSASHNINENVTVTSMTREELEMIAAGATKLTEVSRETIDDIFISPPSHEPMAASLTGEQIREIEENSAKMLSILKERETNHEL